MMVPEQYDAFMMAPPKNWRGVSAVAELVELTGSLLNLERTADVTRKIDSTDILDQAVIESIVETCAQSRQAGFELCLARAVLVLRFARLPRVDTTPVQTPNLFEYVAKDHEEVEAFSSGGLRVPRAELVRDKACRPETGHAPTRTPKRR